MIVVIQCAATKQIDAGHLRTVDGTPVRFVARPQLAPRRPDQLYARPDDPSDSGPSWREVLVAYNQHAGNPLGLYQAYRLYRDETYSRLVDRFTPEKVYILSAGWGLLNADFRTPYYDITFSAQADPYKRRLKSETYHDLMQLPLCTNEPIVFFGGKDYLPLFASLTSAIATEKIVFYNSSSPPKANGCTLRRFVTRTRTNWHYECVSAFIAGRISTSDLDR